MSLRLAAALLALGAAAGAARADDATNVAPAMVGAVESPAPADPIGAWAARLGSPVAERPLSGLPVLPRSLPADDAARAVAALALGGGFEATEALRPFLGHRAPEVRAAAARAIGRIGIRSPGAVADLRGATVASEPDVRLAAADALGAVGDARDVPALLEALASEDVEVRATALRSLRGITGVRLVGSLPRWERWWRLSSAAVPKRLHDALAAVTTGATDDVAAARDTVVRYAWIDVEAVEEAARAWLRSPDSRLRIEGARVAGALRFGGLAGDVRSALRYTSDPVLFSAAADAARAVGVSLADIRKPVASR